VKDGENISIGIYLFALAVRYKSLQACIFTLNLALVVYKGHVALKWTGVPKIS
jgi:hypothetical protein